MRAALCDTALRGTQTGRGYKALQEHTVENRSPHRFEAVAPGVLRAQMGNTRELHSAHSDVGTTGGQGAEQHWDTQHLRTDRAPKVRSPQAMRIPPPSLSLCHIPVRCRKPPEPSAVRLMESTRG